MNTELCTHCECKPKQTAYDWCSWCLDTLKRCERKLHHVGRKCFNPKLGSPLSPRQREILQMLMSGQSLTEIGAYLGVDRGTVSEHKRRIMLRTGTTNDAQLGAWVQRNDYLRLSAISETANKQDQAAYNLSSQES